MRAKKYMKELQQLHKEADECSRQISLLGETQTKLSAENIIATLDDAIDELYEDFSSLISQANHMVSNITHLLWKRLHLYSVAISGMSENIS